MQIMKRKTLYCRVTLRHWMAALAASAAGLLPLLAHDGEPFRASVGVGYRADADIDKHGGDFNETRVSVTASRGFNPNEKLRIEPILTYRFSAYDFSKPEPWDDIHSFRATVMARYVIDEKWAVFAGPSVGFTGEAGADVGDAITFGGALGASYRFSERLTIGAGFTISSEIEDDPLILPLAILNWQINDQWSIEGGYMEAAGAAGPGGEIVYKINESIAVGGGLQYHQKRFRLSDDARVSEGVGEDSSWPLYAKVTWQVCPRAAIELLGGVSLGGELRLEDRNGHKISKADYDPAPLIGLRALFSF